MELQTLPQFNDTTAPQDILRWAVDAFGARLVVVTSFQPTGIAILHMLQGIAPGIPVMTVDTGLLFEETYALIDRLEREMHLRLIRVRAEGSSPVDAQNVPLYHTDPDRCCSLRKVAPLNIALTGYDAWITGVRRDHSPMRADTPLITWDMQRNMVRLSPLAAWTEAQTWDYIHAHDLPYNTLHDRGYTSIGCWPCTQPAPAGTDDLRAGRWAGTAKTECGIHTLMG